MVIDKETGKRMLETFSWYRKVLKLDKENKSAKFAKFAKKVIK